MKALLSHSRIQRGVGAILLACFISSCTNIKNDQTRTRVEGGLGGALAGAALGALVGSQSGNAGRGALIGLAAGTAAGLVYGDHVARKKARYATEEQWLDACIAQARATNRNARAYNARLSGEITRLRVRAAQARASGDRRTLSSTRSAVARLQQESSKQLQIVNSEIASQQSAVNEATYGKTAGLRSEVSSLQDTRRSMSTNIDRLASLGNEVDV